MDPSSLKFAKTHEWVAVDGDVATIGISDFAVQELTDVVHLELPLVGRNVTKGEEVGEIESVKAVSDLYSPVDGEIVEVNSGVVDDLSALSDDPFGAGWLIRVRLVNPSQLDDLMDHSAYRESCESH